MSNPSLALNTSENSSGRLHSSTYQTIVKDTKQTAVSPSNPVENLSQEDRLRQLIIEDLLQKSQLESILEPSLVNKPAAGEVSVKKTIIERLLEELNSTDETAEIPEKEPVVNSGEFISLSDYINNVLQEEAQ